MGASSGLGIELAKQLAEQGVHLVLTARREEPMQRLPVQHGVDVVVEALDLGAVDGTEAL